jgi:hypothetical protein
MRIVFLFCCFMISVATIAQDRYSPCDKSQVYIFDHPQLKRNVDKPIFAKISPMWPLKQDSLQQFFDKHVAYHAPKKSPIQRIILTFTIDCNGNAGEFAFENKERWPIEEHILAACKTEMKKWTPATTKKGVNIDCRQVIIFSVANSKMKVLYREAD